MKFLTDPGQKLDLIFLNGRNVLVDYYSDWIEFDVLKSKLHVKPLIMRKKIARWGIPDEIVTDCGKNYDSVEFSQFCQRKKIKHTKSSPYHHQSNGKAESAVNIVKTLLRKAEKTKLSPYEALLDQHNTPTAGMTTSPAQRFLNRRTRTEVPMKTTLLTPEIAEIALAEKIKKHQKSQAYYDRTAKDLNELKPGYTVRVKPEGLLKGQECKKGTVSQNCGYRSYDVNVNSKLLRRNRVHLKEDQQVIVTEPFLKSGEQKPTAEDLPVTVVEKSGKKSSH